MPLFLIEYNILATKQEYRIDASNEHEARRKFWREVIPDSDTAEMTIIESVTDISSVNIDCTNWRNDMEW